MKKTILSSICALALIPAANAAITVGDTIFIDFGTAASNGNNLFTNVSTADTATTTFSTGVGTNGGVLRNTLGVNVTGVDFSITNMTGDNAGEAAAASTDAWISNDSGGTGRITDGDTVIDGSGDRAYATLTFTGLDKLLKYNVTATTGTANFGGIWQEVNNVSNTVNSFGTGTAAFTNLSTDASGTISFYYIRRSNDDGDHVSVNDISITAIPEPSAALLGGVGLLFLLRRRRQA